MGDGEASGVVGQVVGLRSMRQSSSGWPICKLCFPKKEAPPEGGARKVYCYFSLRPSSGDNPARWPHVVRPSLR